MTNGFGGLASVARQKLIRTDNKIFIFQVQQRVYFDACGMWMDGSRVRYRALVKSVPRKFRFHPIERKCNSNIQQYWLRTRHRPMMSTPSNSCLIFVQIQLIQQEKVNSIPKITFPDHHHHCINGIATRERCKIKTLPICIMCTAHVHVNVCVRVPTT